VERLLSGGTLIGRVHAFKLSVKKRFLGRKQSKAEFFGQGGPQSSPKELNFLHPKEWDRDFGRACLREEESIPKRPAAREGRRRRPGGTLRNGKDKDSARSRPFKYSEPSTGVGWKRYKLPLKGGRRYKGPKGIASPGPFSPGNKVGIRGRGREGQGLKSSDC